jgi:CTP synthase
MSVKEALIHAGIYHDLGVDIRWVQSETLGEPEGLRVLEGVAGIVVPGGFGERGIEGKIVAAHYARENAIPYLGLCLGMQVMVAEVARAAVGNDLPNSTEFAPDTPYPVISLLSEQQGIKEKGGTMRLGGYPCCLIPGGAAHGAYGVERVVERHRHRYEFNNAYRDLLAEAGLVASGLSPDGELVEICEVQGHPFMVGSQFHPEFRSRPDKPHPLFREFIAAARTCAEGQGGQRAAQLGGTVSRRQGVSLGGAGS